MLRERTQCKNKQYSNILKMIYSLKSAKFFKGEPVLEKS